VLLLLQQLQAVVPEVMGLEQLAVKLAVDAEPALVVAVQQSVGRRERVRRRLLHRIRRSWDSRQPESRCFWPAQNSIPE
jgi:hypothetical protein